jgi:hypothetical protein
MPKFVEVWINIQYNVHVLDTILPFSPLILVSMLAAKCGRR